MKLLATNITSPLGLTTEETYLAVRRDQTGISFCPAGTKALPFDFSWHSSPPNSGKR